MSSPVRPLFLMPGGYGLRDHSLGMRDPAPVLKTPKGLETFLRIIQEEQLFFAYVMDGLGAMLLGTDSIKVPFTPLDGCTLRGAMLQATSGKDSYQSPLLLVSCVL